MAELFSKNSEVMNKVLADNNDLGKKKINSLSNEL